MLLAIVIIIIVVMVVYFQDGKNGAPNQVPAV